MAIQICVVGLGYVGLPLAVALDRAGHQVVGYDISERRIDELRRRVDVTNELTANDLAAANLSFTSDPAAIADARVVIVTVPTPVTPDKRPDLSPLESACRTIGAHIRRGTTVVFESTVYPGVTEDICGPLIAQTSGLRWGHEFFLGYSPERINPGDRTHTIDKIVKIISGDSPETLSLLADVYGPITEAGLHRAESIKVAEAAKVIENTQRDLNIALMNELSIIFERLGIHTQSVLEAAGTKWNFIPFRPGLVGGHCIGVDPYYLTHAAEQLGYHPQVILAGRRVNDGASARIAERALALLGASGRPAHEAKVAILGLTFKENVPDIRNSLVFDIIDRLRAAGVTLSIADPMVKDPATLSKLGVVLDDPATATEGANLVIAAVAHDEFRRGGLLDSLAPGTILLDLKSAFPELKHRSDLTYWAM